MSPEHHIDGEEWRDVPWWNGQYRVSNLGRVFSVERLVPRKDGRFNRVRPCILKQTMLNSGYLMVTLGKSENWLVHRLVAYIFLGTTPDGHHVHHRNYDPMDNRLENLEYMSASENQAHAWQYGSRRRAA